MSVGARLHAVVHGDVQGVGFRYFVVRRARDILDKFRWGLYPDTPGATASRST